MARLTPSRISRNIPIREGAVPGVPDLPIGIGNRDSSRDDGEKCLSAPSYDPQKKMESAEPACAIPRNRETGTLALDLGTATGWALRTPDGHIVSGSESFKPRRFEGGGMRYLRFKRWLTELKATTDGLGAVYFEEVRRHIGVDAAHAYGGFLATLTAWCEHHQIPYSGVPVGTIKRHATGKGNAGKDLVIAAMRALGHQPADDNEADALALLGFALTLAEPASAADQATTGQNAANASPTHTFTHTT